MSMVHHVNGESLSTDQMGDILLKKVGHIPELRSRSLQITIDDNTWKVTSM